MLIDLLESSKAIGLCPMGRLCSDIFDNCYVGTASYLMALFLGNHSGYSCPLGAQW